MADGGEHAKVLEGEAALALARQGKAAWNAWAQDPANAGVTVNFSGHDFTEAPIPFAGFIFPGEANFRGCIFGGANFSEAQFSGGDAVFTDARFSGGDVHFGNAQFSGGDAWFKNTQFSGGGAWFEGAQFKQKAIFSDAVFEGLAVFASAVFKNAMVLKKTRFARVPEFRYTKLDVHFTLYDIEVAYRTRDEGRWLGMTWAKAEEALDTDRFRRLKELAIAARDHQREQDFFASELKAKRFHEIGGAALLWSYLYEWCSGFGRSMARPLVCLVATWFVFGDVYALASAKAEALGQGLLLSATVLVPFVAVARGRYHAAYKVLFGDDGGLWVSWFAMLEGVLGLAFVFLIGLALRNRFRI